MTASSYPMGVRSAQLKLLFFRLLMYLYLFRFLQNNLSLATKDAFVSAKTFSLVHIYFLRAFWDLRTCLCWESNLANKVNAEVIRIIIFAIFFIDLCHGWLSWWKSTHQLNYVKIPIDCLAFFKEGDEQNSKRIPWYGRHNLTSFLFRFWPLWVRFASFCPLSWQPIWL